MGELFRLLLSLGLAGLALTLAGGGYIWAMNEDRRIRRSLARVLGEPAHAYLIAHGRGKGLGFNFATNHLAVTWDAGGWCLVYRLEELIGAELAVDGQVLARVHRGEGRRALDMMTGADSQVAFRLIFDDAHYPDFVMDLWLPEDDDRRGTLTAPEAVQEANRWIARIEAVLRRPVTRREPPLVATPAAAPVALQAASASPAAAEASPWADDEADEP